MLLYFPNLVGSHAGLAENSDVARSVIPDDHIELLRCDGERHSALLLHARTNVRHIDLLRDILTDQEAETDLVDAGTVSQAERSSAAKITLACASPFAFRIWPLAHRNLDDIA